LPFVKKGQEIREKGDREKKKLYSLLPYSL
jgi:hypothetical protein